MTDLFPLGTGIGRVRGIIGIIKQNKGSIGLSELASESGEQIDNLLPLVEACKLLGFAIIDDAEIKLTKDGRRLTIGNSAQVIKSKLGGIEPFRSTITILKKNYATSNELFDLLHAKGIVFHGDKDTNSQLLKKMLIRWGVRSKLISYDPNKDEWRVK